MNYWEFNDTEEEDLPQAYTPEQTDWLHNPETGYFDLVLGDEHSYTGHTGGNALWGSNHNSSEMDFAELEDVDCDIPDVPDMEAPVDETMDFSDLDGDLPEMPDTEDMAEESDLSEAEKAAEYARACGFEKAADYIARHYDGMEFIPGAPIPIKTRNMALEGSCADNGVEFERRVVRLSDDLLVEGVFPNFNGIYHVELGGQANDMSEYQQFSACKADFQDHMFDIPEIRKNCTIGDMERMDLPQGYTPKGYTWDHNPRTGEFRLVSTREHTVGHTGGNALWGAR